MWSKICDILCWSVETIKIAISYQLKLLGRFNIVLGFVFKPYNVISSPVNIDFYLLGLLQIFKPTSEGECSIEIIISVKNYHLKFLG